MSKFQSELESLREELRRTKDRLDWAANELLACDYGDNNSGKIGWVVYGWRDLKATKQRRIYGESIDIAIDNEIRKMDERRRHS